MTINRSFNEASLINTGASLILQNPVIAARMLKQGIKINPTSSIAYFNLGIALHKNKRIQAAITAYKKSLSQPEAPVEQILNNLAQDHLLIGDMEEGWKLYENRLISMRYQFQMYYDLFGIPWRGLGETRNFDQLLIVAEQGYGDTIQFCRYISVLDNLNIKYSFFCSEALAPLLRESTNIKNISTIMSNNYKNALWCPLLSLPFRLNINNTNYTCPKTYINPSIDSINYWEQHLQKDPSKKLVAIHWQGNPKFEQKIYSHGRSMPFLELAKLGRQKNVEFLSIQKGNAADQLNSKHDLPLVAGQERFNQTFDFKDTAAALKNCDLLISADSSVVHLAGAMGVPTWVALSWVPEWRWGCDGDTTKWYKSMRLFRQHSEGDWDSVINSMIEELNQ